MNILTNYNNFQQTAIMARKNQVKSNNLQSNIQSNYQHSQNVSFTGMDNLAKSLRKMMLSKQAKKEFKEMTGWAADVLGKDAQDVQKKLNGNTKRKTDFYALMVEKYNRTNFYAEVGKKENPELVDKIFDIVEKPSDEHFRFVDSINLPFAETKTVFEKLENNPKKINIAGTIYNDISGIRVNHRDAGNTERTKRIFMDMINSPNREEYLANYESYKPHIHHNAEDKNVIKLLDEKISAKSYDKKNANNINEVNRLFTSLVEVGKFNRAELTPHYSKEANELVKTLDARIAIRHGVSNKDADSLAEIYKTTTKDNAVARGKFIESNYYFGAQRDKYDENEISNIGKVFKMMDEDPNMMKFINKLNKNGRGFGKAESYLKLADQVGTKVLNRDADVIGETIGMNRYHSYESVVEHYEQKPKSIFGRAMDSLKGLFKKKEEPVDNNIYWTGEDLAKMDKVAAEQDAEKMKKSVDNITENDSMKPTMINTMSKVASVDTSVVKPQVEKRVVKHRSFFKPYVPKQPSAKKLVVINDVNNIIENKLGKNVYADQSRVYANKATKMRLSMLPEIFDSIKETRAAARKNGTFNKRTTEKNEDALDLYQRINGKNKRLVNYMLKVRNEDGTRKYTVKDIVNTLSETSKTVRQEKMAAPKDRPFRAKDEKAMYDILADEQIAKYGKLHQAKSKKVNK